MQERLCDVALYHTLTWTPGDFAMIGEIVQRVIAAELGRASTSDTAPRSRL